MPVTPFRCGTPHETDGAQAGQISRSRRISYGRALRTYTARRQGIVYFLVFHFSFEANFDEIFL